MRRNNDLISINLLVLFACVICWVLPFWATTREKSDKNYKYYAGAIQVQTRMQFRNFLLIF